MAKAQMPKLSDKKKIELDVICRSLIGKEVKIVDSRNKTQVGIGGVLVFESANLFFIKTQDNIKEVLKSSVVIEFELDGKKLRVDGRALLGTLTSRIKKIK